MKNKSFVMKILLCGSFLLILLFLIVIFSLIRLIIPKKDVNDEKKIISKNYDISNINNNIFDFKNSNSIFKISETDELVITQNSKETKFYLNEQKGNNQLRFEEDLYLINPQKKKYTIYIPKKYLNKITIINGFGKIKITGVPNDFNINNNSGKIYFNEIGNIELKDVSGDVNFKNVQGDIIISSSTGNINVINIKGTANIDTITGDIKVTGFEVTGDSYFENVSGDISIKMSDQSVCKIKYFNETGTTKIDNEICKDELNIIDIKNITGLIKFN